MGPSAMGMLKVSPNTRAGRAQRVQMNHRDSNQKI
jgi:hypothetical protein